MMKSDPEAGAALVLVLMATLLVSAAAAALALTLSTEATIAANFQTAMEAKFAVRAMLERGLSDLNAEADWSGVLAGAVRSPFVDGLPEGVRRIDGQTQVDLRQIVNLARCGMPAGCTDVQIRAITSDRPWGANNPRWQLFAYGRLAAIASGVQWPQPHYVVLLVGDDPAETDDDPERDEEDAGRPGAGVVMVRAEVFGPRRSHRALEAAVARHPGGLRTLTWREVR